MTRSACVVGTSSATRTRATDAYRPGGVRISSRAGMPTVNEVGGPAGSTGTTTSVLPRTACTISASREVSVERASSSTLARSPSGCRRRASSWTAASTSAAKRSRSRAWASFSRLPRGAAPVDSAAAVPAAAAGADPGRAGGPVSSRDSTAASSTWWSRVAGRGSDSPAQSTPVRRLSRVTSVSASAAASWRRSSACGTPATREPSPSTTSTLIGPSSGSPSGRPTSRGSAISGSQIGPSTVRRASCAM